MVEPVRPMRDGWIILRPGDAIEMHVDTPISPHQHEVTNWVRNIRGGVLSSAFDLENILEVSITTYFIGEKSTTTPPDQIRRIDDFQELIMQGMSFEKKMRLAQEIAKKLLPSPQEYEKLTTSINQVRNLRNVMAHCPCWLEAIKIPGTNRVTGFTAYISKGKNVWEVNKEQVEKWQALLLEAVTAGENLLKLVSGNKAG